MVALEVSSKRYRKINFLLLNKIFYQLITFGLFDKHEQVSIYLQAIFTIKYLSITFL